MAVVFAMLASYLLSRTLIPTMVHYMLKPEMKLYAHGAHGETAGGTGIIWRVHYIFNRRFEMMRSSYTRCWTGRSTTARRCWPASRIFMVGSLGLVCFIGHDFFPTVDSGQMRLHARAPAGTRIEETEASLRRDRATRSAHVIPPREIDTIIDNIGIPNGGFNLAYGDSPTIGTGDGDILISLKPDDHGPTADYTDTAAQAPAPRSFPDVTFFFEAGQHHQPDSEFRPARAHRSAGGGPQRRRPITRSPSSCERADRAAFPAPPTCTSTRWSIIPRSASTWTATRPARSA